MVEPSSPTVPKEDQNLPQAKKTLIEFYIEYWCKKMASLDLHGFFLTKTQETSSFLLALRKYVCFVLKKW